MLFMQRNLLVVTELVIAGMQKIKTEEYSQGFHSLTWLSHAIGGGSKFSRRRGSDEFRGNFSPKFYLSCMK